VRLGWPSASTSGIDVRLTNTSITRQLLDGTKAASRHGIGGSGTQLLPVKVHGGNLQGSTLRAAHVNVATICVATHTQETGCKAAWLKLH